MLPPGLVLPTPSFQDQIHELAKTLPPPRKQNTACDACRSVAFPPYPHRTITPPIRARKVKCYRLPGQDKVCRSRPMALLFFTLPPFHRPVSGKSLPFHPLSSPEFTPPILNQHCLSKNYPCTSVFFSPLSNQVTSPDAHRHYVQQATSEKKRNGAARRPRGISTSSRFVYASSHRISCLAASHPRACWCHMVPFAVILPVLPGRLFDRQSLYPQNLNISVLAIPPWKTAYSPGPDPPGEPP